MNDNAVRAIFRSRGNTSFDLYERRTGTFQLIAPIMHEDGDMIDIYLQDSPEGEDIVRITDFGMTLMRLSYSFDIHTPTRQRIFDGILNNNGVKAQSGNLFLDTQPNLLYESVLQFAGCVQKVTNMRYWNRESVRSAFYEDFDGYVTDELVKFEPVKNLSPIDDYPISVDWSFTHNRRNFYLFGVLGNEKAKNVAIALLEFQKANLPFMSLVVHEDIEDLGNKERLYLTKNADTQYPVLNDFREKGITDIKRFAVVTDL